MDRGSKVTKMDRGSKVTQKISVLVQNLKEKTKKNLQLILIFAGIFFGFVTSFPLRCVRLDLQGPNFFWLKIWGELFLRLLYLLMIPLILFSIIDGVSRLSPKSNDYTGLITFLYIFLTNGFGTLLGLISGTLLLLQDEANANANATFVNQTFVNEESLDDVFANILFNIFPDSIVSASISRYSGGISMNNKHEDGANYLGLVTFSLILGFALTSIDEAKARPIKSFVAAGAAMTFAALDGVMWTAPVGFCSLIIAGIVGVPRLSSAFSSLFFFFLVVFLAFSLYVVVFIPTLVFVISKQNPIRFFKSQIRVAVTAFATQNGVLTLPALFRANEDSLSISPKITRFALPLCAIMNRDASNIFNGAAYVFVAQFVGFHLSASRFAVAWLLTTVLSTSSTPSMLLLILVCSTLKLKPQEAIGLLFSMDWFLIRIRTVINCLSHSLCCFVVHHVIKHPDVQEENPDVIRKLVQDPDVIEKGKYSEAKYGSVNDEKIPYVTGGHVKVEANPDDVEMNE